MMSIGYIFGVWSSFSLNNLNVLAEHGNVQFLLWFVMFSQYRVSYFVGLSLSLDAL